MHVLAGMLLVGLLCNFFVRPVNERHYMSDAQLAAERATSRERQAAANAATMAASHADSPAPLDGSLLAVTVAWSAIALPLGWGVWITLTKALTLFK